MNVRKVFGSLTGFVVLAGVSMHQVSDGGPTPTDTAIMAGTAVARTVASNRNAGQPGETHCGSAATGRSDHDPDTAGTACAERQRR